jgi:flagellar biosynthetic protein FlhB
MAEKGQRTEKPTPKRVDKARREGNFPAAREMVGALQFLAFASMLAAWGSGWILAMRQTMRWLLERAFTTGLRDTDVVALSADAARRVFLPMGLAGGLLLAVTLAAQLAATNMGISLQKLAPDLQRLNPPAQAARAAAPEPARGGTGGGADPAVWLRGVRDRARQL